MQRTFCLKSIRKTALMLSIKRHNASTNGALSSLPSNVRRDVANRRKVLSCFDTITRCRGALITCHWWFFLKFHSGHIMGCNVALYSTALIYTISVRSCDLYAFIFDVDEFRQEKMRRKSNLFFSDFRKHAKAASKWLHYCCHRIFCGQSCDTSVK